MIDHDNVVARISREYAKKGYRVQIRGNNLPTKSRRDEAIYRPDLLVRDSKNNEIVWIVEVETSEPSKAVVGAILLADVCMEIEMQRGTQREKPRLLFIFYAPKATIKLATKRIHAIGERLTHLHNIEALTEREALQEISDIQA